MISYHCEVNPDDKMVVLDAGDKVIFKIIINRLDDGHSIKLNRQGIKTLIAQLDTILDRMEGGQDV